MEHDDSHEDHHKSATRLIFAIGINLFLTFIQILGGLLSGSLSLVADALHNLGDAGALVVAAIARKVSGLPATSSMTYGYGRAEILGALINSTILVVVGIYLIFEALGRFIIPKPIDGWIVIIVASLALFVDLITALLTYKGAKDNLNFRAVFIHNASDALASLAVIFSGTMVLLFEAYWVDWLATLLISSYILYHSFFLIQQSVHVIMQAVPEDLSVESVKQEIEALDAVQEIHHLHIWQIHERFRTLEAHLVIKDGDLSQVESIKKQAKALLKEKFKIKHSTLEIEVPAQECPPGRHCAAP